MSSASPATIGGERSLDKTFEIYATIGTISNVKRHSRSAVPLDVRIFSLAIRVMTGVPASSFASTLPSSSGMDMGSFLDANRQYARHPTTVASIAADVLALRHSCPDQTQGKGKT